MSTQAWELENDGVYNPQSPHPDIRQDLQSELSAMWDAGRRETLVYMPDVIERCMVLISQTVSSCIGPDFDVSKIPFGSAQIEAIVANRLKNDQRTTAQRLLRRETSE